MPPPDGIIDPIDCPGISSGHDDRVLINPGITRRADLLNMDFGWNNLFPFHMTAALGPFLILKEDAGSAGPLILIFSPDDIQSVAEAGIPISNHRNFSRITDLLQRFPHLGKRKQSDIRLTQTGGGDGITAHCETIKSGCFGNFRRQRVIDSRRNHECSRLKISSELETFLFSGFHACAPSARREKT